VRVRDGEIIEHYKQLEILTLQSTHCPLFKKKLLFLQIHNGLDRSNLKLFKVSQVVQWELSTHTKHPVLHGSHVGGLLVFKKKPGLHDEQ
jgi:hypothetical protein